MGIIWTLIIGFIVGLVARAIKPGADTMGWIMTIVLGIAGSFVGGLIASVLNIGVTSGFGRFILSAIGAITLLFIYELIAGKRKIG